MQFLLCDQQQFVLPEILFYNKLNNGSLLSNDMAIKLKTKEG